MDRNDQQAIDGLFSKLAHVEQQSGQRDAASDRFIQERVSQQPSAPYYMAQTIVVQEQALDAAQRRIEELEYQASHAQQGQPAAWRFLLLNFRQQRGTPACRTAAGCFRSPGTRLPLGWPEPGLRPAGHGAKRHDAAA